MSDLTLWDPVLHHQLNTEEGKDECFSYHRGKTGRLLQTFLKNQMLVQRAMRCVNVAWQYRDIQRWLQWGESLKGAFRLNTVWF